MGVDKRESSPQYKEVQLAAAPLFCRMLCASPLVCEVSPVPLSEGATSSLREVADPPSSRMGYQSSASS